MRMIRQSWLIKQKIIEVFSKQMRRGSLKKASTFKLQAIRNEFRAYLEDIQECPVVLKHPEMLENIRESSQAVFDMCYSFSEHSPFSLGLNYDFKCFGFEATENLVVYREWLPGISEAYLMGEFNNFNKTSHKLKPQEEGQGWYMVEIDNNENRLEQGSKVMLRVVDHQEGETHMIPPSCHIIENGYGLFMRSEKMFLSKNKMRTNQLLAYTLDLAKVPLQTALEFVEEETKVLECFNTIIIKNLFSSDNKSLLNKFSLSKKQLELARDLIIKLKEICGVKVVLEWSLGKGPPMKSLNVIEEGYLKVKEGASEFKLATNEVKAYYLSNISYYYNTLAIDGLHCTNLDNVVNTKDGLVLIKCINILCERLNEQSVRIGSSKANIEGIMENITEGGLGFSFIYNHHESLILSNSHMELYDKFTSIHGTSNLLSVNYSNCTEDNSLNLMFTYLFSEKGVLACGDFSKIRDGLRKILKLRRQSEFFSDSTKITKLDDKVLTAERGNTVILFNFSPDLLRFELPKVESMETVYKTDEDELEKEENLLQLKGNYCVLLEKQ